MNTPSSVLLLIPHYNNPKGLKISLASIEEQEKLNVLIVDDGSKKTDLFDENALVKQFGRKLALNFLYLKENQGIEYALNKGLLYAQEHNYKFIARLDCDDTCYPNRFKLQRDYLVENPEIKLLGTQVNHVNDKGELLYTSKLPLKYKEIKRAFYINCVIYHPTVMYDLETVLNAELYPTDFHAAEDYALFMEIIQKHRAENLDIILVDKLIDEQSISSRNRKKQIRSRLKVMRRHFRFGLIPIYGIIRSLGLYLLPRELTVAVRKTISKK